MIPTERAPLLPCPFCGSPAATRSTEVGDFEEALCSNFPACSASIVHNTSDEAAAAWNKRVAGSKRVDELVAELQRAQETIDALKALREAVVCASPSMELGADGRPNSVQINASEWDRIDRALAKVGA